MATFSFFAEHDFDMLNRDVLDVNSMAFTTHSLNDVVDIPANSLVLVDSELYVCPAGYDGILSTSALDTDFTLVASELPSPEGLTHDRQYVLDVDMDGNLMWVTNAGGVALPDATAGEEGDYLRVNNSLRAEWQADPLPLDTSGSDTVINTINGLRIRRFDTSNNTIVLADGFVFDTSDWLTGGRTLAWDQDFGTLQVNYDNDPSFDMEYVNRVVSITDTTNQVTATGTRPTLPTTPTGRSDTFSYTADLEYVDDRDETEILNSTSSVTTEVVLGTLENSTDSTLTRSETTTWERAGFNGSPSHQIRTIAFDSPGITTYSFNVPLYRNSQATSNAGYISIFANYTGGVGGTVPNTNVGTSTTNASRTITLTGSSGNTPIYAGQTVPGGTMTLNFTPTRQSSFSDSQIQTRTFGTASPATTYGIADFTLPVLDPTPSNNTIISEMGSARELASTIGGWTDQADITIANQTTDTYTWLVYPITGTDPTRHITSSGTPTLQNVTTGDNLFASNVTNVGTRAIGTERDDSGNAITNYVLIRVAISANTGSLTFRFVQ